MSVRFDDWQSGFHVVKRRSWVLQGWRVWTCCGIRDFAFTFWAVFGFGA